MAKKTSKTKEVPVDNSDWYGASLETDKTLLTNDGSGKPIILRTFDFDLPPIKPSEFPTKQQLIDFHKTKITAFLWRDELVPIQKLKLIFSKNKLHFRIFATCQAREGSVILEEPELIQNTLNARR